MCSTSSGPVNKRWGVVSPKSQKVFLRGRVSVGVGGRVNGFQRFFVFFGGGRAESSWMMINPINMIKIQRSFSASKNVFDIQKILDGHTAKLVSWWSSSCSAFSISVSALYIAWTFKERKKLNNNHWVCIWVSFCRTGKFYGWKTTKLMKVSGHEWKLFMLAKGQLL